MFSDDTKNWVRVVQGQEADVMSVLILQFITLLVIREVNLFVIMGGLENVEESQ